MPKTRLNREGRAVLRGLVEARVTADPKFDKDAEKWAKEASVAHAAFDKLLVAELEKRFPPVEMAVLTKYNVSTQDTDWRVTNEDRSIYTNHRFAEGTTVTVPYRYSYSGNSAMQAPVLLDSKLQMAWNRLQKAKREHEDSYSLQQEDLRKRRTPYYQLIDNARNFEDVLAVWPEAEAVAHQIVRPGTSIALIPDSVKEAIAADMQRRAVA